MSDLGRKPPVASRIYRISAREDVLDSEKVIQPPFGVFRVDMVIFVVAPITIFIIRSVW